MSLAIDVVKQRGKRPSELFDPMKLHNSIVASCLSVKSLDGLADDTARRVCEYIISWCDNKTEVTTLDIRHQAARALDRLHPEAAHLYKHHKVIL